MLVGVCDFPSDYQFPPIGYGGIERWLWAVAVGARSAGADVHLLGPRWRPELADRWTVEPVRLEDVEPGSLQQASLSDAGYDLLVGGHEYPSLAKWRRTAGVMGSDVATFQHDPNFRHTPDAFDAVGTRLYCYSQEMIDRYASHDPIAELAVHLGLDEDDAPVSDDKQGLVWLGRVDEDKAPHIAIRAAAILKRRIKIIGPVMSEAYVKEYRASLAAEHVDIVGEVGGADKTRLIQGASAFVYTYARDYVEAGAAVFGEALRAGTPVAALTWRDGTCAHSATCGNTGRVVTADPAADDEAAAQELAGAIEAAMILKPRDVREIGLHRFDPESHFRALARRS